MSKILTKVAIVLGLAAMALSGCGASDTSAKATTIGLTYIPNIQFSPFYVAKAQHLFSDTPVELRHHGADEGLFNALLTGKEDAVVAFGDEAVQAISEGMDLAIIGILYQHYPVTVIANRDSAIQSWSDLRGKTVGVPGRYGSSWFGFQAGLAAAGLSLDDVKVAEIGYTQQAQLTTRKVDAVVGFTNNDLVRFQLAGVDVTTLELPADTPMIGAALITTGKFAKKYPQKCRDLVNGMVRGVKQVHDNPDEAINVTKQYDESLSGKSALQAARVVLDATNQITALKQYDAQNPGKAVAPNRRQVRDMIAVMKQMGALGKKKDVTKFSDAELDAIAVPWTN